MNWNIWGDFQICISVPLTFVTYFFSSVFEDTVNTCLQQQSIRRTEKTFVALPKNTDQKERKKSVTTYAF